MSDVMLRVHNRRGWVLAARWGGAGVCVGAAVLFFATRERVIGFDTRPLSVAANAGRLTIVCNARMTGRNGWIDQDFYADLKWWFWWRFEVRPPMALVMTPLWVIALAGAGACAAGRRARPACANVGACAMCGYDRRGLARGAVCPECGE